MRSVEEGVVKVKISRALLPAFGVAGWLGGGGGGGGVLLNLLMAWLCPQSSGSSLSYSLFTLTFPLLPLETRHSDLLDEWNKTPLNRMIQHVALKFTNSLEQNDTTEYTLGTCRMHGVTSREKKVQREKERGENEDEKEEEEVEEEEEEEEEKEEEEEEEEDEEEEEEEEEKEEEVEEEEEKEEEEE
ncbi:hypothetical protein Pmani_036843 [Petrolisthes manimaculis]|uniref:Uncharacterized protein n=1 Tax=Petrolisthes manimaculis TaxID=1843537 RepID=A0AAE1NIW7_9EUCA|nr:hypothetical protein Pmani_036843 [Petrolisthes manimaculis]